MEWLRILLLPFALLYGVAIWLRNLLFDTGILPSKSFPIPVISVGNLSAGGAGKTPHVEYLVDLLKNEYRIAVLSRGYKRKTKGFLLAGPDSTASDIGDEPLQIHKKHPDILVAVQEKRRKGIERIMREHPEVNLIILDDAFQHRYVNPGLNLLLTGYYNPFFRNFLLPVGNLREAKRRAKRADALVVTKTPKVFSPLDRRFFVQKLRRYKLKNIYFSRLAYQRFIPMTPGTPDCPPADIKTIFLLTGIANPESLQERLKTRCKDLVVHRYPDHHQFREKDLKKLRKVFTETISHSKIVVTTEKDAMRMESEQLREQLDGIPVYCLPVRVAFHRDDKRKFDRMVFRFLEDFHGGQNNQEKSDR